MHFHNQTIEINILLSDHHMHAGDELYDYKYRQRGQKNVMVSTSNTIYLTVSQYIP